MPIKIPDHLPAQKVLESENIFVMNDRRASTQDIRPLRLIILNLMPTKIETETQLLRLLGNTPLQLDIQLLQTATHIAKNTSQEYLTSFYHTFDQIKDEKFDGMIVTGAPVELMPFEEVDYWAEFCTIMEWSRTNVYSSLYICWGAQAALHYFYGINTYRNEKKIFGIYPHHLTDVYHPLVRGLDDTFYMPHSRWTGVKPEEVQKREQLIMLATSEQAGASLIAHKNGRRFFLMGHPEYDRFTLDKEYRRDLSRGVSVQMPYHYYPNDDPAQTPALSWRSSGSLIYANWLNYYVYQQTPYDLRALPHE